MNKFLKLDNSINDVSDQPSVTFEYNRYILVDH